MALPTTAQAEGLPDWLNLSGSFRVRYEGLTNQFHAGRTGNDQILAFRTTLLAKINLDPITLGAEFIDSRTYLDDAQTPLSTSIVDAADILQAYVGAKMDGVLGDGSKSELKVGRITIDMGDRRLVARNRFRNTINAFTGMDWTWVDKSGRTAQVFLVVPVSRRPTAAADLRGNHVKLDKENFNTLLVGIDYVMPVPAAKAKLEVFAVGIHESDGATTATANRRLVTPGFRFYSAKAKGAIDFQIESILQFGKERASKSPTAADLDVFAHFEHGEIGYTFAAPWSPRIALQYDYASGDKNPADNKLGRFNTLYGARRFDFGPTGIYGPFARSNLSSPGLRTEFKPSKSMSGMMALRGFWLASRYDAWAGTGVSDPTGASGRFLGTQIEGRFRWTLIPGNLQFEAGLAHLFNGHFINSAPNATGQGDTTYGYTRMSVTF